MIRELPFGLAMRLWDTYMAEGPRMKDFLIYVLAAFLTTWSATLRTMEFQDIIMFLQACLHHPSLGLTAHMRVSRRTRFDSVVVHLNESGNMFV